MAKISPSIHLSQSEIDHLLTTESRIRIATIGPGTEINLTPMTFGYAGGQIYIFGRGQKVVNLRRNPTTTVLVDVGDAWRELQGVMMRGTARILEDAQAEQADLNLAAAQLNLGQKHGMTQDGEVQPYKATAAGSSRRWIVFEPTKIVTWDNSKLD